MPESSPEQRFTIGQQGGIETEDTTLSFYERNAKEYYDETVNINMTVLYTPFLTYMPTYASVLDAGCGSGRDTLYFSSRGYKVTAFDNAPTLVELATKLTGQKVLNLSFLDLDFENQFDGIWACSSLIHFPPKALQDVLSKLSRSLKVAGVMYASFKYGSGEHYRNDIHYFRFDEDAINGFVEQQSDFSVIRCWKSSDFRPDRSDEKWLNLLVRKTKPTSA